MAQKWDYQITEDGGCEMCEWWHNHFRAAFWTAAEFHQKWLEDLRWSHTEELVADNMRKVRWARAEMRYFQKEQDRWFEAGKKYGMIPF